MRSTRFEKALTKAILAGGILIIAGTQANPAGAQSQAEPQKIPEAQQPLSVQTSLVNVFATVRNNHRAIVSDLKQEDFRIYEDNQEQKIAFFSKTSTMPITLGMLIDTSGSQTDLLLLEQEAASRFIHRVIKKGDMAMIMNFDIDVDLLADFTEDTALLEAAIHRTVINAGAPPQAQGPFPQLNQRGTALYDAIYLACNNELSGQTGRKAIVILTDAQDIGSKLKLEDAIEAAQRADTVVHIILIADPSGYGFGGYYGASVAKRLADETGGRVIDGKGGKNLEEAFDQLSEELRSQYVLGYYPTNAARDGTFRKLKVETTRSGMKVLARRGYYASRK